MQVFTGQVRHAEPIYVELDQWVKEIARGAQGWVRSVAGVTADKRFVGVALWESANDAQRHTARPEQDHWWRAFSELFEQVPTVTQTADVVADVVGDPEHARFVQVVRGHGADPARARELLRADRDEWAATRPEILATVAGLRDDGEFTMVVWFTDEAAARAAESRPAPPKLAAALDELNALLAGQPEFFDLREPWLQTPAG